VEKWTGYVSSHEQYEVSYGKFTDWLTDLHDQLAQCTASQQTGDRHAIDELQSKLQVANLSILPIL